VGDDFQAMARKMLPFEVGAPEAEAAAAPAAAAAAPAAADAKTSEVESVDHQLAAAAAKRAEEGSPRVEPEVSAAGSGDAIAAGSADVSGEVIAAA
jgi:hypothetical protein